RREEKSPIETGCDLCGESAGSGSRPTWSHSRTALGVEVCFERSGHFRGNLRRSARVQTRTGHVPSTEPRYRTAGRHDASSAITGVDADVLGGEVAGPNAGCSPAFAQVHADGDIVSEQAAVGSAFVQRQCAAAAIDGHASHFDGSFIGIELDSGAP